MNEKNHSKKSFGFNNTDPVRNSSVFLPHIPGKNYENPKSFDDVSIFDTLIFDESEPSDEEVFCYNVADYESDYESDPTSVANTASEISADTTTTTAADTIADSAVNTESEIAAETAATESSAVPASILSLSAVSSSAVSTSAVSTSTVSTSAVSASAVSASAVSASASSASVVSTSAVSTSAVSTSAVSASAVSASAVSASAVSASAVSISADPAPVDPAPAVSATAVSVSASSASASSTSASSGSAPSVSNKRKRAAELKSIGLSVPGPSYCATKKKPVKRPISSRLSVITYPVKTYKKPMLPKQVPLAVSGPSVGPKNGPIANISAAIACSSFTPNEYAKKVKALELLTGQRDVSVNPFCKIVVTGIDPKPFRLVKKGLIDMSILVCMVVNIQFVGKTTEFTIYKSYKGTFLYKLASNSFIKVISS
ncbi:hypothetical protein AYI69_g10089 [Smittium culicis]|uniref:Uncharacterized protein n=1 Tax=Smittium culicis TaxID=133412 RepID=A0A1R1X884_9FUNG|nr:hypothetical protein AYI69_g10089 [Smittium culicis]